MATQVVRTKGRPEKSNNLKKTPRGSVINKYGVKFLQSELKEMKQLVSKANYRYNKYIKEMTAEREKSILTRGSRIPVEPLYWYKSTAISNFQTKSAFKDYMKRMRKQVRGNYMDYRMRVEVNNYMEALRKTFSREQYEVLEKMLNKMTNKEMHNAFIRKDLEHIGYVYYSPEGNKFTVLKGQLELLLKKI